MKDFKAKGTCSLRLRYYQAFQRTLNTFLVIVIFENIRDQTLLIQEETLRAIVRKSSPGRRSETTG